MNRKLAVLHGVIANAITCIDSITYINLPSMPQNLSSEGHYLTTKNGFKAFISGKTRTTLSSIAQFNE